MSIVPTGRAARLAMAKGYPFEIPGACVLYEDGQSTVLSAGDAAIATRGRVPVIGCGSNQSPAQIARKYSAFPAGTRIPMQRARLAHFDVVYSAHITAYGAIAATLQHVERTEVAVAVLWLDPDQLAHMHTTESPGENYAYVRMERIDLALADGRRLDAAWAYNSLHGCLLDGGEEVALAAVPAHARRLRAHDQEAMLAAVHRRVGHEDDLDSFILANVHDPTVRRARIAALRADALPFRWPHAVVETV